MIVFRGARRSPMTHDHPTASMYRRSKAGSFFVERARQAFEKVYDEKYDTYFYYNKVTETSQWTVPRVLLGRGFEPRVGHVTSSR